MTDTNRSCATCVFGKLYEKRNLREYQPKGALPVLKTFASDHPSAPQHS